jgi:hypothetical protein
MIRWQAEQGWQHHADRTENHTDEWSPAEWCTTAFTVTVRQLPTVRCDLCRQPLAHPPGQAGDILTKHYQRRLPGVVEVEVAVPHLRLTEW